MKKILFILTLFVVITGCGKNEGAQEKEIAPLLFASAQECRECHELIYNEWKDSMHAKASPLNDKVHAAVFKATGNDIKTGTKDGKMPLCVPCHVPTAALDGEVDLTKKPVYAEGVTCSYCHRIKSLKNAPARGVGAHAYEYSDENVYFSGIQNATPDAHKAGYEKLYTKAEYCNGCHEKRSNEKGVSVCDTFDEYKLSRQSKYMQCQNCHMPHKDGYASESSDTPRKVHFHGSSGGHNIDERFTESVEIYVKLNDGGKSFSVMVNNKNAAHRFPTASPLRQLYVKVIQLDANGKVIRENYKESPAEDANALFNVAFESADAKVGVPPWEAVKVSFDRRLKPNEERILIYDIAGKNVKKVRAELYYALVPKKFAEGKGFDESESTPHLLTEMEIDI